MALLAEDPHTRIDKFIRLAEPRIRDAVVTAMATMAGAIEEVELLRLIETGNLDAAIDLATNTGFIQVADEVVGTYIASGQASSKFIDSAIDVTVSFDQVNFRAVDIMRQERLRLIEGFNASQRSATRSALTEGIFRGDNPIQQAKTFRNSIGLTETQQGAVINYRRLLETGSRDALDRELRDARADRTVLNAISRGKTLSTKQIDSMVDRYYKNYKKFRAETIAATETLRAAHSGNEEAYEQAYENGHLAPEQVIREWINAHDHKVRSTHVSYGGQKRKVGEMWGPLRYPQDPAAPAREVIRCRCSMTTRIFTL